MKKLVFTAMFTLLSLSSINANAQGGAWGAGTVIGDCKLETGKTVRTTDRACSSKGGTFKAF